MQNATERRNVDERGQGLVEYSVILMLIAAVSVAALTGLGGKIVTTLYEPVVKMFP